MSERLRGVPVSPGVAIGPVHFKRDDLVESRQRYILANRVDEEMARFRRALEAASGELVELKRQHEGELPSAEIQILDVHRAYLADPSFLLSVEKIVRGELLRAESAIARVVGDFERVMELVENPLLQERAEDLRDVGLRVLRWMRSEGLEEEAGFPEPAEPFILAARRLAIADIFALDRSRVLGILAEEGGVQGHAAILARSMRIPALTGVQDLFDRIQEGDFVILDAAEGEVRVRPDERVLREFEFAVGAVAPLEGETRAGFQTADGEEILLVGSCGTLADVDRCVELALGGVGVYRTELLFMAGEPPSEEMSMRHYREVMKRAGGAPVTFRLLDAEPSRPDLSHRNPALGLRSLRALLARQELLRLQLRAFLRAAAGADLNLLIPFVTLREEVETVRGILAEEQGALAAAGEGEVRVSLGACVEVPAVALALPDLLTACDFAVIGLDDLIQHLLAADRDSLAVRTWYQALHPGLFRLLAMLAETAAGAGKPVGLFGETAADVVRLPFHLGVGFRTFSISPVRVPAFARTLGRLNVTRCRELARRVLTLGTAREIQEALAAEAPQG